MIEGTLIDKELLARFRRMFNMGRTGRAAYLVTKAWWTGAFPARGSGGRGGAFGEEGDEE